VDVEPPGPYAAGQSVQVTARPADNWFFTGWSGARQGSSNPLALQVAGDVMLTANFAPESRLYLSTVRQEASLYITGTATDCD
jgi:hypothetical protein